jgi:hypothetical protein
VKHVFKKAILSSAVVATMAAMATANAAVVDKPSFKVLPVVVVWGGDGAGATQVADFIVGAGAASADLISGNVTPVVTGSLTAFAPDADGELSLTDASGNAITGTDVNSNGILDAGDSLAAFSADATAKFGSGTLTSSFYVASNTAFNITASVANGTGDLAMVGHQVGIAYSGNDGLAFGGSSKSSLGNASTYTGGNLGSLNGTTILDITESTANAPGSIADQSVRIDNTYTLATSAGGLEMSPSDVISADVTYTVAIP